jgi:hypothetical protein
MEEKRSAAAPVAIAVLLLLPVLYVGSYLVISIPQPHPLAPGQRSQHFRIGGSITRFLFKPLTEIDRRLRPNYWGGSPQEDDADL